MTIPEPKSPIATSIATMTTKGHPSNDSYRTLTRKTAVALLALLISLSAVGVWLGLLWVELYSNQMSELIDSNPEGARIKLIEDLRLMALATGTMMSALAAFLFWYGMKSLRTQSMPPGNSWVIEGQRIRTGSQAVLHAKLLLVASAVIGLLGIVGAVMLWHAPVALLASQ